MHWSLHARLFLAANFIPCAETRLTDGPVATRAFSERNGSEFSLASCGASTAHTPVCTPPPLLEKLVGPGQSALAPADAQLVPWFDRLAPGRNARGLGRGEAREASEDTLECLTVSAEGAEASAQRHRCPSQRATD